MDVESVAAPTVRESLESVISGESKPQAANPAPARADSGSSPKISPKDAAKLSQSPTKAVAPAVEKGVSSPRGESPEPRNDSAPEEKALRAPNSWKPLIKEKWGALPREVQQEVLRREREASTAMTQSDEARKGWNEFRQTVAPYEGIISAEGARPMEAVKSLLDTAMALRTAPPMRKATMLADMIRTFNIPIEMLAQALDGQAPQQQQTQQEQYRDPRVDQLLQKLNQATESRNKTVAQKYTSEAATFSEANEFFSDVRENMAKLIEAGFADNFQEAYEKACMLDKDISGVLKQREQADRNKLQQNSLIQKSRNASASIRSRPSVSPKDSNGKLDVRSALEAAMAAHQR